jgi:hypothetical protein
MSVLLTLEVATDGRVIIRRALGECKVKSLLLRRRCSVEGKIWWLDKWNFITENQVEQVFTGRDSLLGEPMFKVEYDDTKKEMQKENEIKAERKTQRSTSGKLFNGAHYKAETLVEIQVFHFLFYFLLFFLICITKIGSTPIFSSIGQKVWPIEIPQFSARNLKHHPDSELGALEVEFVPLPLGKPGWVWLDVKFDSTQFQKKLPDFEFR